MPEHPLCIAYEEKNTACCYGHRLFRVHCKMDVLGKDVLWFRSV